MINERGVEKEIQKNFGSEVVAIMLLDNKCVDECVYMFKCMLDSITTMLI